MTMDVDGQSFLSSFVPPGHVHTRQMSQHMFNVVCRGRCHDQPSPGHVHTRLNICCDICLVWTCPGDGWSWHLPWQTTEGYKDDPLHQIQCIIAVMMGSLFLKADDPPSDDLKLKFKLGLGICTGTGNLHGSRVRVPWGYGYGLEFWDPCANLYLQDTHALQAWLLMMLFGCVSR